MPLVLLWAIALSAAAESPDATSKKPEAKVRALGANALKDLDPAALLAVVTEPLALKGAATDGLIFERTADGQSDLWQVRLSDSAVRRLLDTPDRNETQPSWSPQAKKLLYQVRRGRSEKLVLFDPGDGTELLLRVEPRGFKYAATWSPDGKHVAYAVMSPYEKKRSVREYNLKTGTNILRGGAFSTLEFVQPTYSPDGMYLSALKRDSEIKQQIWLLERGEKARQVTRSTERSDNQAAFTRDGKWIVFTSTWGKRPSNLNLIRPDGTGRHGFASSTMSQDSWAVPSPTRDEVAFISTRENSGDLFLADIEEVDVRNLSKSRGRFEKLPVWSPDGELLAATVLDKTVPGELREPHVIVFTREGEVLLEVPGRFASWMSPWAEPKAGTADGASTQSD